MSDDKKEKPTQDASWGQNDTGFNDWVSNLEDKEQPSTCSVDSNDDCESCGS